MNAYLSWCPGLADDARSIQFLTARGVGIETSGIQDMLALQKQGVPVSLHNIVRWGVKVLGSPGFQEQFSNKELLLASQSDASTLGFHLPHTYSASFFQVISDVEFLKSLFPTKTIVLELPPVWPENHPSGVRHGVELREGDVSIFGYVHTLLAQTHTSLLFDTSHVVIAASQFTNSWPELEEWIMNFLDSIDWNVKQLHINVPSGVFAALLDTHGAFSSDEQSELILRLVNELLRVSPIETVTFEMDSHLPAFEHVSYIFQQAKLIQN